MLVGASGIKPLVSVCGGIAPQAGAGGGMRMSTENNGNKQLEGCVPPETKRNAFDKAEKVNENKWMAVANSRWAGG